MCRVPLELEQCLFNKVVVSHGYGFGFIGWVSVDEDRSLRYVFKLKTGEGEESFMK